MNLFTQTLISLLLLNSAQAVVIFHQEEVKIGRMDRVQYPNPGNIDLNSDGTNDILIGAFQAPNFGYSGVSVLGGPTEASVEFLSETIQLSFGGSVSKLLPLSEGELISSPGDFLLNSSWIAGGGIISEFYSNFFPEVLQDPFTNKTAYLGLRFRVEDEFHYGYLHIRGEGATGATVFGYAWETEPGRAIAAGAIPEPSTSLFTLLGLFLCSQHRKRGE